MTSNPADGEVYSIQYYVIQFVSDYDCRHISWRYRTACNCGVCCCCLSITEVSVGNLPHIDE